MNVLLFHLMPYADLDLEATKAYPTTWTTLPNTFYDPKKGTRFTRGISMNSRWAKRWALTACA